MVEKWCICVCTHGPIHNENNVYYKTSNDGYLKTYFMWCHNTWFKCSHITCWPLCKKGLSKLCTCIHVYICGSLIGSKFNHNAFRIDFSHYISHSTLCWYSWKTSNTYRHQQRVKLGMAWPPNLCHSLPHLMRRIRHIWRLQTQQAIPYYKSVDNLDGESDFSLLARPKETITISFHFSIFYDLGKSYGIFIFLVFLEYMRNDLMMFFYWEFLPSYTNGGWKTFLKREVLGNFIYFHCTRYHLVRIIETK